MSEIKEIVKQNLIKFRKQNKLTQIELAKQLDYSDKAISRWETGETTPDIETLEKLANVYGVQITDFFSEKEVEKPKESVGLSRVNKFIITLLSAVAVWFIIIIAYVYLQLIKGDNVWQLFVLGVPCSAVILIVFSSIWGNRFMIGISVSLFVWSALAYVYLEAIAYNMWLIFIVGIPIQIAIVLATFIKNKVKNG